MMQQAPAEHRMMTPQSKRSVLLVKDNPTIRMLLKYVLKTAYEVHEASCVEEALCAARTRRFDALVLDINLGETRTGSDLLELLRGLPAYRTVPAIACTASPVLGAREHLFRSGFDACVDKPFTREQLHTALERLFSLQSQGLRPSLHRVAS